jgi:hypothetical protein
VNARATRRREGALARLRTQLQSGTRPSQVPGLKGCRVDLTEADVSRIKAEIATLERRI